LDNGEKLLTPEELLLVAQAAQQQLKQEKARGDRLAEKLRELGIEVD